MVFKSRTTSGTPDVCELNQVKSRLFFSFIGVNGSKDPTCWHKSFNRALMNLMSQN